MIRRLLALAPVTALREAYADLTEQPAPPAPRALADLDRRFADLGPSVIAGKNVRPETPETTLLRIVPVKNVIPIRGCACGHADPEHEVTVAGKTFHVCDGCRPIYTRFLTSPPSTPPRRDARTEPDAGRVGYGTALAILFIGTTFLAIGAAKAEHVFAWLADHPISRNGLYGAVIVALLLAVAYAAFVTFVQRGNAETDVAIAQADADKWPAGKGARR